MFMVEGYTDVIAMHQAGIENVVANSGTALSLHQIHMLHRFTQNITLLYDGDEAGIHDAMRGTDMLLSEGMNIKVLLLPDGDDPDSFARKHSSDELRKYIEENQTDFITFKTRLTVENNTDPVKRSEAIGGIVKSISVIPDQILRSTYLTDFSQRIGMKEQTLIAEMNKYIRKDIEDREKELARQQTAVVQQEQQQQSVPSLHSPQEQASQIELLLVREIVRHGEEIIYDNVETEDGGTISLNVAEYIDFDLSQDELTFSSPLDQKILQEAVAHGREDGFKAVTYFCGHTDPEISQLATRLAIDRYQLGGRFVMQPREGALRDRVKHLVADFRLDILRKELKNLEVQMRRLDLTTPQLMELLKKHKETKEFCDLLAKQSGRELIV